MDDLYQLLTLAGVKQRPLMAEYKSDQGSNISITGTEKRRIEREKNIKPGTPEWFKLWFSLPYMTGEKPVAEAELNEIADKPYDYIQNVKTPLKRAYRFQTDAGQLYRVQALSRETPDIKNFGIKKSLEIHFDLTDMKTGKPDTSITGTGDAVRVFSTVANILQKEVAEQNPPSIVIASKADDTSRVKLYRTLARRAAKIMPDYEVAGENTVTGADGNSYLTIELKKK